ncbi:TIGR02391 family protein [archaeon]|nr:TIGR02391 family protein [archaeon]
MEENNPEELVMSFDPHTIEHLGIKMYSTLPPVLSELIANAHDADAHNVKIILMDSPSDKIIVEDDGEGMSFTELNNKFLRIGRNRREDENRQKTKEGRLIIGKKGLGKLAFFGIAEEIEIETIQNEIKNSFLMVWEDIKKENDKYKPKIIYKNEKVPGEKNKTRITLKKLKIKRAFNSEYCLSIADSISKIFIIDSDFKINVRHNYESDVPIRNERKYESLDKQIEWKVPQEISFDSDYDKKEKICGTLIATKLPISAKTNLKGITLFSRKKLVNLPEYFSNSISSHFFSYLTGWLEVDFIENLDEDVISTNRQSLNWDHPEMEKLRNYLNKLLAWLERDWRRKRVEIRSSEIEKSTGIKVNDWFSKLPPEIKRKVEPLVNNMIKNFEPTEEDKEINSDSIRNLHSIIPEYTYWHYRNLHPDVKSWAFEDYKKGADYYESVDKASRAYIRNVKDKASLDRESDESNIDEAFKLDGGKLKVNACNSTTEKTIQRGHHSLSKGVVAGCRNPLNHNFPNYQERLGDTGLFSEQDCLDMLSLISHLQRRLDNSELRFETSEETGN